MATPIMTADDLALAVRSTRRARGLTQDDLALVSGTGRRFIIDLERGKPTVRLDRVLSVLAALDLRVELIDEGIGPDAGA